MEIGFIGLGKMGANMVRRLRLEDHRVVAYNRTRSVADDLEKEVGSKAVGSFEELISELSPARVVWIMVPEGNPVDATLEELRPLLSPGDIIIDGGNSRYTDTVRRSENLKKHGLYYIDAGTSGGVWGLEVGYCLMVGGEKEAVSHIEPALKTLAPPDGYLHVGSSGSGHYVKMVHNGIEYGIMQAYAEGFDLMENVEYDINLEKVAHLWNRGSVVRSWLLELCENFLQENPTLKEIEPFVQDSGEGRWTVEESIRLRVPAPVIASSLYARFSSRQTNSYAHRFLSALRNQFGGHAIKKSN